MTEKHRSEHSFADDPQKIKGAGKKVTPRPTSSWIERRRRALAGNIATAVAERARVIDAACPLAPQPAAVSSSSSAVTRDKAERAPCCLRA